MDEKNQKSEIIKSFQKGMVNEIIDILWDIYEKVLTEVGEDDIEVLFNHFDYNNIRKVEKYYRIE